MTDRAYKVIENEWITLADGTRLAARIWMPDGAEREPVPAVLEFLPYRKRDGTAPRDESTYPVLAQAGYAGVRVDIRGSGESEGVIDGEYTERELSDACEVIAWITSQPWSSGAVGMMGISWGGFNGLQVAALQPPGLKAVISIATTVDRYNDDIHYKNGCHLSANLGWAATMLCYQTRAPDPALVGDRWREMWLERLANEPFFLEEWLAHQRRDDYWRHGSICEDFSAVQVPALVIAGWADGYRNTPLEAVEGMGGRAHALIGPWVHKYPHFALPKPRMDFHADAIRWWDRWLKGAENGVEDDPQVRAYILDGPRPAARREHDPGAWKAVERWSKPNTLDLHGGPDRQLRLEKTEQAAQPVYLRSPQDTGTTSGEYFTQKPDAEMAGDQRPDNGGSLVFETAVLDEAVECLGRPVLSLSLSADAAANLAVRLIDVHPDGAATRVSFGVLNLAHRDGNADPQPMTAGVAEGIRVELDACGYRFGVGHRIQIALSTAYWPLILPQPTDPGVSIDTASVHLALPLLGEARDIELPEPPATAALPAQIQHRPPESRRTVERDMSANRTHYRIHEDTGVFESPNTGLVTRQIRRETWTIAPDDPLSATAQIHWTAELGRGDWSTRTETTAELSCTAEDWVIAATVTAYEGDVEVHRKEWKQRIRRDFM